MVQLIIVFLLVLVVRRVEFLRIMVEQVVLLNLLSLQVNLLRQMVEQVDLEVDNIMDIMVEQVVLAEAEAQAAFRKN